MTIKRNKDYKVMREFERVAAEVRKSGLGRKMLRINRAFHGVEAKFLPADYADKIK